MIQVIPRAMTTRQCQRLQGRRSMPGGDVRRDQSPLGRGDSEHRSNPRCLSGPPHPTWCRSRSGTTPFPCASASSGWPPSPPSGRAVSTSSTRRRGRKRPPSRPWMKVIRRSCAPGNGGPRTPPGRGRCTGGGARSPPRSHSITWRIGGTSLSHRSVPSRIDRRLGPDRFDIGAVVGVEHHGLGDLLRAPRPGLERVVHEVGDGDDQAPFGPRCGSPGGWW